MFLKVILINSELSFTSKWFEMLSTTMIKFRKKFNINQSCTLYSWFKDSDNNIKEMTYYEYHNS